jgi:hypothetical protein
VPTFSPTEKPASALYVTSIKSHPGFKIFIYAPFPLGNLPTDCNLFEPIQQHVLDTNAAKLLSLAATGV